MTSTAVLLTTLALLPFVGSVLASFLPTRARNAAAGLAGTVSVGGLAITIALYRQFRLGDVIRHEIQWLPQFDMNLVLRLDGLSWIFAMLVMGIGALIVLYARYYMSPDDPVPRFFTLLLAFMGAMLGIVISGNLIQLVFFWELTSLFSFLLIGYWYHNANAREGAKMALTVTALGGFCLLLGVIVIGRIVGSFDIDTVLASGALIQTSPHFAVALILILIIGAAVVAAFPLVWMVLTSLKTPQETMQVPPVWLPREPSLEAYTEVADVIEVGRSFVNSAIIALVTTAAILVTSLMAGYAFAKYRFRGRNATFLVMLATLMIPGTVTSEWKPRSCLSSSMPSLTSSSVVRPMPIWRVEPSSM